MQRDEHAEREPDAGGAQHGGADQVEGRRLEPRLADGRGAQDDHRERQRHLDRQPRNAGRHQRRQHDDAASQTGHPGAERFGEADVLDERRQGDEAGQREKADGGSGTRIVPTTTGTRTSALRMRVIGWPARADVDAAVAAIAFLVGDDGLEQVPRRKSGHSVSVTQISA